MFSARCGANSWGLGNPLGIRRRKHKQGLLQSCEVDVLSLVCA
jgi:hypothetical protein